MRKISFYLLFFFVGNAYFGFSQSDNLPLNDFYKRQFLQFSGKKVHENFFPANETHVDLHTIIRDSSVFYSAVPNWIFQKHWIQIEKNKAKVYISPLIDFSIGDDVNRSKQDKANLYRNTRGAFINGAIGDKFSFFFSFAENQARFMDYENAYFRHGGEFYVKSNGYNQVNATIPGGSRTKDFKVDAFDYAYSVGMVNVQATKKLRFEFGNQSNFIGAGYRSLLLSDHSINALGLRTSYQINDKWSYQWLLKNHRNLYRKPKTNFVESPYENKLFNAVYLTYKPVENFALSIFSGANTLIGDSIKRHSLQWQSIIPLPIINTDLALDNTIMNGMMGLNMELAFTKWRLYGQVALDKINVGMSVAGQLGVYYFDAFGIKNWSFQLEGNAVPKNFYTDVNSKLSYSHAQVALAHPKGHNFAEIILRTQYEWKRFYAKFTGIYYHNLMKSDLGELGSNSVITQNLIVATLDERKYSAHYEKIEIGYRFNRRYNGMVYINFVNRTSFDGQSSLKNQFVMVGLRTSLFNQYFDF